MGVGALVGGFDGGVVCWFEPAEGVGPVPWVGTAVGLLEGRGTLVALGTDEGPVVPDGAGPLVPALKRANTWSWLRVIVESSAPTAPRTTPPAARPVTVAAAARATQTVAYLALLPTLTSCATPAAAELRPR